MISIIIRTHNEERWISQCLKAVFRQDYKDFEVIIVDNNSSDMTLAKAKAFQVKILKIKDYLPGKALNLGIREARGEFICCLSGHCIPTNNKWLSNLLKNFQDKRIAGVYGRQEPMSFTGDFDKRDLLNLFGLDKKVQIRDSFFHNANSMLRREVWKKIHFDDRVTNIEDRVWAKKVLKNGYKIIYEPEASVYHYHGIHQDNDQVRCSSVVRILESLTSKNTKKFNTKNLNIIALIPIRGEMPYLNGRPLLEYTIKTSKLSRFIKRIIVSTDSPQTAELAINLGAEAPFLRKRELSQDLVDLEKVLQYSLDEIEKIGIFPDIIVVLEITYPFRQKELVDNMIKHLIEKGLDSVIPVRKEYKACWVNKENKFERVDSGFMPRVIKEPLYVGLVGLGCITHPFFIREGRRLGDKVGFIEINDFYSAIEVRDKSDLYLADRIIDNWLKNNR